MKKRIFLFVAGMLIAGNAFSKTNSLIKLADEIYEETWTALTVCGVQRVGAYENTLPRPQIIVDEAAVNGQGRVVAYGYLGLGEYEFKAMNGGFVHGVKFDRTQLSVSTPNNGIVAAAQLVYTPGGPVQQFRCGPQYVNFDEFKVCVRARYIDVITGQLCH